MLADYVVRGAKAGLVAGLLFGLFVALVANPLIAVADGQAHAGDHHEHEGAGEHGEHHHESAVSATTTDAVSVASSVLWGLLLGAVVFGVVGYFLEPLVPGEGAIQSYVLAAGGFVTVSGGPWLLIPPTVPGAERAIATETGMAMYGGMIVASALACLLAAISYDRLRDRRGRRTAGAVALVPLGALATVPILSPFEIATGSLSPELAGAVLGTVVFGQVLLWLALAATHARLEPTADEATRVEQRTTDPSLAAD